jgi:hypothetical protein
MIRIVIFAALAYVWGTPGFESLRPSFADAPLETYHIEVRNIVTDTLNSSHAFRKLTDMRAVKNVSYQIKNSF